MQAVNSSKPARVTKKEQKERGQLEAIQQLQAVLKPGDEVGCIVKKVSGSGMYRHIALVVCRHGSIGLQYKSV